MKFRGTFILLAALFLALPLSGQSNAVLDTLLNQKSALCAETAYLALVGGGALPDGATPEAACIAAVKSGWLPKTAAATVPITVRDLSLLLMKSLKLKGGVMYSIFPSSHYAFRELVAQGVVNGSGGPDRVPTGEEAVMIIGKAVALKGDAR